jgi:hypothetical protein
MRNLLNLGNPNDEKDPVWKDWAKDKKQEDKGGKKI